jgi:hypothetical protein
VSRAQSLRAGDGVQGRGDIVLDRGDGPVQERDVVQVDAGEPGVVVPVAHAIQRLLDARPPGPDLSRGQAGQDAGVALAADERLQAGLPGDRRPSWPGSREY